MSDKMKAAALSAATKGLSRVQAERATANATRNVNAYGQKEEGPSRWQEKKQAKTQMYLESTEKQATLNQKRCQRCRQAGHWTSECQKPAPVTPKVETGSLYSRDFDGVDLKKEEKGEKGLKKKKKDESSKRKHKRRKHRSSSSSELSDSESDEARSRKRKHKKRKHRSSSSSESSDSESEDERRRKRKRHSRKSNGGR